jgi:cytochrome P450
VTANVNEGMLSERFFKDPHEIFARMRSEGPVQQVLLPGDLPVWFVTRYDDARKALNDARPVKQGTFTPMWYGTLPDRQYQMISRHMAAVDPPEHTRLRKLVSAAFTNRRTQSLRPRIQEITDELLDGIAAGPDEADLMGAFAFPLTTRVIFELIGIGDIDQGLFLALVEPLISVATTPEDLQIAVANFAGFIHDRIEEKTAQPGGDLLSAMLAVRDGGDRLSEDELSSMMFLLLTAGQVTTVDLIGNGVFLLLRDRSGWERLQADRSLLPSAIEEFLRYESPLEVPGARMASEAVDIGGTVIPAGAVVMIALMSGNRDAERWADADEVDLARADNPHLAFGYGIHHCLGAPLARLEADIAFTSLLDRFPDLALAGPADAVPWRPSFLLRGPAELRVTGT